MKMFLSILPFYLSWKIAFFSVFYFIIIVIASINMANYEFSNSLLDYIVNLRGGGSASELVLVYGIVPLIALVFPVLIDQVENEMVVTRYQNQKTLLNNHLFLGILISGVLTLVMVIAGIIASYFFTGIITNLWGEHSGSLYFLLDNKAHFPYFIPHVSTIKLLPYVISTRFLFIILVIMLTICMKMLLRKNIYTFGIIIVLFASNLFTIFDFNLLLDPIRIDLSLLLSFEDKLFNQVYLLFGIVLLFYVSRKLHEKKEFY